jgi:hypothetical protein
MTKTLTANILSAAIASPVLAQDAGMPKPIHHGRAYDQRHFRGAYDQLNGPFHAAPRTFAAPGTLDRVDTEGFGFGGFSGRDPSRVGGEDPSLNPPAN